MLGDIASTIGRLAIFTTLVSCFGFIFGLLSYVAFDYFLDVLLLQFMGLDKMP